MKKLALAIAVLLSINISHIWAEGNSTNSSSVRYVKAPRFARPLIEKWITEYEKTQPGVEFRIAKGNQNQGNIDLKSRHIKDNLTIIGIDVKKNLEKNFSDKATLDEMILALENSKVSEVAVEKIGVSYNEADDAINQFLNWVLTAGTKYNHEYGLLNLDNKLAQVQIEKVKTEFTAQK
jgi:ABC-type phosphate transport system substrate-binding protein